MRFKRVVIWTPALGRLISKEMSRSIHWTYKIFKNKSKRELAEMCDFSNPDYAVKELRKKMNLKRAVKEKRAEQKINNLVQKKEYE